MTPNDVRKAYNNNNNILHIIEHDGNSEHIYLII